MKIGLIIVVSAAVRVPRAYQPHHFAGFFGLRLFISANRADEVWKNLHRPFLLHRQLYRPALGSESVSGRGPSISFTEQDLDFSGASWAEIVLVILDRAGLIEPGWQYRLKGTNITGFGLSLVGGFLYHSITEGMYGASLGKLICQLRVVTEKATPISIGQALLRSLAYYFDALFFGLVAYNSMRKSDLNQRYGDRWAHTVVAKRSDVPDASRKGGEIFALALLMGSVCWAVLLALGIVLHAR